MFWLEQHSISFNEIKTNFEESLPNGESISLESLQTAAEFYDLDPNFPELGSRDHVTFHDFFRWYTTAASVRNGVNQRIRSLNVLQRRFNQRVDPDEPLLPYGRISDDQAVALCRFFAEDLWSTILGTSKAPDGRITFHEIARILVEDREHSPLWQMKLNDLETFI